MSSTPLPPYFSIDPDQALADLGEPTTTSGLATMAQSCAAGRDDLAGRGLSEDGGRKLRLFSKWEITRYLIPVATAHFRHVLKQYLPYRPKGLPAKMVAVANFKGGVGKTSTAAHLAMLAALDGYKVLVIDLDSQASMTSIFDGKVEDEWQTVFPLLARHYATHLQADNQRRVDRGDVSVPLDETLTEALSIKTAELVQSTHWPNID